MTKFIRKFPKKIHPAESHFTMYLAQIGFEAIKKQLVKDKAEPLDADETEAITKRLLRLLDECEGND